MAHWRKDYKKAPPLARPNLLAHMGTVSAVRDSGRPTFWRIAAGLLCWAAVLGAIWIVFAVTP